MALDKGIKSGKEHRKPYRGAKAIDATCRNHGSCPWCKENRQHKFRDKQADLKEWRNDDEAADANGAEYRRDKHGSLIMNDDNDAARRTVEQCYRTRKTMVNPIVDWEEEDVWGFLNGNNIPHCCLYDEGFTRLGCIGCPMSGKERMKADFERWPKYRELYLKAFAKMINGRKASGLSTEWKDAEEAMRWWLQDENG